MAAESDLYSALSGFSGLTDMVGTNIFSDIPEEGREAPFVYFERTETEPIFTIHDGAPIAQITYFDVAACAALRDQAEAIADEIIHATASDFITIGRSGEYDEKSELFISVLQLEHQS